MPAPIHTSPTDPAPTHDIVLSDGISTYGLIVDGGFKRVKQIPQTASTLRFTGGGTKYGDFEPGLSHLEQRTWQGGRGNESFVDDPTRFYDSLNAWTLTPGKLIPGFPLIQSRNAAQTQFTRALLGTANTSVRHFLWQALTGTTRGYAIKFTPVANLTADKAYLWIRRRGQPGTLTIQLRSDSAGAVGAVLKTVAFGASDFPDLLSVYKECDWETTEALTSGTPYWLAVSAGAADNAGNHWEVGLCQSIAWGSDVLATSSDASAWTLTDTGGYLYFRVQAADVAVRWKYFFLDQQLYTVSIYANTATASTLWQNGTRGKATAGGAASITDTNNSTTVHANAWIRIIRGTGRGQARKVSSGSLAGGLSVTPAWDTTPDTTSEYVVYATDAWSEVTGTSLGAVKDVTVCDNIAYFAQGAGDPIRKIRFNAGAAPPAHEFADDGSYEADLLHTFYLSGEGQILWRAVNGTTVQVSRATPQPWGTATPWTKTLTGTVDKTAGELTLAGTSTVFDDEVSVGDQIIVPGTNDEMRTVTAIAKATALTVDRAFVHTATGQTATTGRIFPVGDKSWVITKLLDHDSNLFVMKEDSVWYIDGSDDVHKLSVGLDRMPEATNGAAAVSKDLFLYFSWAFSVEQYVGETVNDVGLWKGTGLPPERQGVVADLENGIGVVFAAVDAGADGISSVHMYDGAGWHELVRAWNAGERIQSIKWQPCPGTRPRLWLSINGEPAYLEFPKDTLNPLSDQELPHTHEAALITSTFDTGAASLPKLWKVLSGTTESLGDSTLSGQIFPALVEVDYQADEDIGTETWRPAGAFYRSPLDEVELNLGDSRAIRFRLRLQMSRYNADGGHQYVPVVNGTVLEGYARTPYREQWAVPARVSTWQRNRAGESAHDPDEVLAWVQRMARTVRAIHMTSRWAPMHDKRVLIEPAPVSPAAVGEKGGRSEWDGEITLLIREA